MDDENEYNHDTTRELFSVHQLAVTDANDVVKYCRNRLAKMGIPPAWFNTVIKRMLRADDRKPSQRVLNPHYIGQLASETPKQAMLEYRMARKGMPRTPTDEWERVLREYLSQDIEQEDRQNLCHAVKESCITMLVEAFERIHDHRKTLRSRVKFNPVKRYRARAENAAHTALCRTISGWRPLIQMRLPGETEQGSPSTVLQLSIGWKRQTDALGATNVGSRFITKADLVDQIGEYDLYQITYHENGERVTEPKYGFVAKYRDGNIRGFGNKPETALQWTRRQVLVAAQRKMGVI